MLHFIELLGLPFLVCVAMTAILGYLGIHVLSREIVFVDIALAQIVAVAILLWGLAAFVNDDRDATLLRFGLAAVLQMLALTLFVAERMR